MADSDIESNVTDISVNISDISETYDDEDVGDESGACGETNSGLIVPYRFEPYLLDDEEVDLSDGENGDHRSRVHELDIGRLQNKEWYV